MCRRHQYKLHGEVDISPGDILIFYYTDVRFFSSNRAIACCLAIAGEVESQPSGDTVITLEERTSIKKDLTMKLQELNIHLSEQVTPVSFVCDEILEMLGT